MASANVTDSGNLWWSEIAGPANLVADIENALAEGQSVLCNVTTSLSFRWTFRDTIGHWLSMRGVEVVHIDCNGLYCGEDIVEFLLRQTQVSMLMEYQRRRTPQFMRDKGILHGKLLWIRGVEPQYLRKWFQYISSYRSHDLDHGLFLMEVQSVPTMRLPQNLRFFNHDQYIRKDDLRLYAAILAERYQEYSIGIKQYAVELVTSISVMDGELSNDLLARPELVTMDPIELLRQIVSECYSDSPRGQEAWHPFSLLHTGKTHELLYRIWSAQIRVGYPQIELERLTLVNRWYRDLENALSTPYLNEWNGQACRFTDFEAKLLTDPKDLEIGMILKLSTLRCFEANNQYLFYLPNQALRERIRLLRDCRNRLAHLDLCTPDDFLLLLSGIPVPSGNTTA